MEDFKRDIYIQKRRISKNLWLNNPDCDIELTLENFEE